MTLYLTDNTDAGGDRRGQGVGHRPRGQVLPRRRDDQFRRRASPRLRAPIRRSPRWSAHGLVLSLHGEVTDPDVDVFDRERVFVERQLARDRARLPRRCGSSLEHVTTREAAAFVRGGARQRRRDDHAAAPALFAQRAVRRRPAAASLLPAGAQARDAPRGAGRRRDRRAARSSSSAPTRRRTRAHDEGERLRLRRLLLGARSRSSSTPKPSRTRARSSGSRRSRASTARPSTACRAMTDTVTLVREPWHGARRLSVRRRARSCRFARARRCAGASRRRDAQLRAESGAPVLS